MYQQREDSVPKVCRYWEEVERFIGFLEAQSNL